MSLQSFLDQRFESTDPGKRVADTYRSELAKFKDLQSKALTHIMVVPGNRQPFTVDFIDPDELSPIAVEMATSRERLLSIRSDIAQIESDLAKEPSFPSIDRLNKRLGAVKMQSHNSNTRYRIVVGQVLRRNPDKTAEDIMDMPKVAKTKTAMMETENETNQERDALQARMKRIMEICDRYHPGTT